jgi:hypothetical protein
MVKALTQSVGFVKKSTGKGEKETPLAARICCNKIQALKRLEKRFREKKNYKSKDNG